MRRKRTMIYVNANLTKNEIIYTGIEFQEFFECLHIENLILLKGKYMGERVVKYFEVIEGQEQLGLLAKDDIYNYGDFCFVDYQSGIDVEQLTDMQVAELLYIAHMYEPLKTPFFDILKNKFAYLAHDDGFFCKLYCRENEDFAKILEGKLTCFIKKKTKRAILPFAKNLQDEILRLSEKGILIDIDEVVINRETVELKLYSIGKYTDMDKIYNNFENLKSKAEEIIILLYSKQQWSLT